MIRKNRKSIRNRLAFWFLLVSIVPLAVAITIVYFQRVKVIKQDQLVKLSTIRDLRVKEIKKWFAERKSDLYTIASDQAIKVTCQTFGKCEITDLEKFSTQGAEKMLNSYYKNNTAYSDIFIVNPYNGVIEMATDKTILGTKVNREHYFLEPLQSRSYYIEDIHLSKTTKKPTMTFSLAVTGIHDERLVGILVARVNLESSLYVLLLDRTGMGKTGETLIVNRDVYALNQLRGKEYAPLKLRIQAQPAVRAARGETGVIEAQDYRQINVLAAFTHIPLMDWGFVAKQDLAEIYTPIRNMLTKMLILVTLAIIVVLILAFFIARSIASPIIEMSTVASKIAQGNLNVRNRLFPHDELGILAKSFNSLADSLLKRMSIQDKGTDFISKMIQFKTYDTFCMGVLEKLIDQTDADFGVFLQRQDQGSELTAIATYGIVPDRFNHQKISVHDTLFETALLQGSVTLLTDIPADTQFYLKTIVGTSIPKAILAIPITTGEKTSAIISLGSMRGFTVTDKTLISQVLPSISTAFATISANEAIHSLATELEQKNEALVVKTNELQNQSNELRNQAHELNLQRAEVEEANRMKNTFLANMSHELRTPLNSILTIPQGMLASKKSNLSTKEKDYLEIIERNAKTLLHLINDILDLSKIEVGKFETYAERFDLNQFITECIEAIRPLVNKKALVIIDHIADQLPPMHGDQRRLKQVFNNIVGNAIKFTEKGSITITAGVRGSEIFIDITDTGIGMNKQDLLHIFEKFKQLEEGTTRRYEGAGLGLYISKKIMRLVGGDILVSSTFGQGSTFTIVCPREMKTSDRKKKSNTLEKTPKITSIDVQPFQSSNPDLARILVVEDNPDAREQISNVVSDMSLKVETAVNGEDALAVMAKTPISGIILDLMMPGMDGFKLLDTLRQTEETRSIPVLVLTAKELTKSEFNKLKENNVTQLILKGTVDLHELKYKIANAFHTDYKDVSFSGAKKSFPQTRGQTIHKRRKPKQGRRPQILIIEDNPDNIKSMKILMEEINCDFIEARDGRRGLSTAMTSNPDLVLLDIQLPGMSGYDVAAKIRNTDQLSDIPMVAVTAHAMKGNRQKILTSGFDDYISKPLNRDALLHTVKKYLDPGNK